MSLFSVIGAFTYAINQNKLNRFLSLFVAMASGTLLGGAFFHMIPHGLEVFGNKLHFSIFVILGFFVMYALELFVQWHHCQKHQQQQAKPQGLMILVADGLHNFIGGLGIGAAFLVDSKLGIQMWVVALFHEIPQEIGDLAILLDSGFKRKAALILNFISSLTFPLAMLLVYGLRTEIDSSFLIPIAAGNFIYIAASDLIPEVKEHPKLSQAMGHLLAFTIGLILLYLPYLLGFSHL